MFLAVDPVVFSSRVLHILFAMLLLGGAMFTRFALLPAAAELPEDIHTSLKERIANRWRKFVMLGIAVLLATGFYNYLKVTNPLHAGDKIYGMLMGMKILLALVMFVLASGLAGRSKMFAFMRKDAATWLLVLILLGSVVTGMASFLKIRDVPAQAPTVEFTE